MSTLLAYPQAGTTGNITLGGDIDSDGTLSFSGPVLLAADAHHYNI